MSANYYKQGKFIIKNPEKYKGQYPIIYRSGAEFRIMKWADNNPNIIYWQSESAPIPYIKPTDGKIHRYFIDFTFYTRNKDGSIGKYLVEYKPSRQTQMPVKGRKSERTFLMEQMNYVVNMAKWKAAREFAKANGMRFMIITEKDLDSEIG